VIAQVETRCGCRNFASFPGVQTAEIGPRMADGGTASNDQQGWITALSARSDEFTT